MSENSMEKSKSVADEALLNADVSVLHKLFNEKCEEIDTLVTGFNVMLKHSDKVQPRPLSDETVLAMRDVALAAIRLAEKVAVNETT